MTRLLLSLSVALPAVLACASAPPAARSSVPAALDSVTPVPPTLSEFAGRRMVLLPVQRLRVGDTLGWAARAGDPGPYLRAVDDEIAFALADRGVAREWMMPADAARALRRNPTFEVDAYALDVAQLLVRPGRLRDEVTGPLASQLRTITALGDARYALVPAELRFEPAPQTVEPGGTPLAGAGRAMLRSVLVDTRLARVLWRGEVMSDPQATFSPALAASLALRLADLFAASAPPDK